MPTRAFLTASLLLPLAASAASLDTDASLDARFTQTVQPFLETYCVTCHGNEKPKGDINLSAYPNMASVVADYVNWDVVLEQLENGEMPSQKAKKFPTDAERKEIIDWVQAVHRNEAARTAGDPGPVLARRLSNAEYDYTIRDLTGANIRPTREFPVDPANQAGFDNTGESLTMSPALLKKYLGAAREVSEHLVLKPDGFEFASHPVVADTDRDKYSVLKIVDFYQRQPTDYTEYFVAAWRYQNRALLGQKNASLSDIATSAKVSPVYLATILKTLSDPNEKVGPIAKLQTMWRALPEAKSPQAEAAVRESSQKMRDFVVQLREKIVPEVKNLTSPKIENGSQTLVMRKNRVMAANRRRYDPNALQIDGVVFAEPEKMAAATPAKPAVAPRPSQNSDVIQKGGKFLAPALTTTGSSATFKMAASKKHAPEPDLVVPADPAERAKYEAAFERFASVFPDAFYITERARVYLDAEKEQKNAGRLLSAGLHSMTGYFRDDGPLYDLVLDDKQRAELDRLWLEFDFSASIPERMHTSFVWFERTDSSFMRDPEFDPFRPEDKSVTTQAKIKTLGELYLAKAQKNNASEAVQEAIKDHFQRVATNIASIQEARLKAEPGHLKALEDFAARAYRRPLTQTEREGLHAFYRDSRNNNNVDHEEAMRDCVAAVLMSPKFCYRIDLVEAAGGDMSASNDSANKSVRPATRPLSDYALASRLSYFLWSSMPDAELLAHAAAGDLHKPEVLKAQARRMLKDPRIRDLATEFGGNWLDFRRFEEHNSVDRERFPTFDNDLRQAMFEEPIRFFVDLVQSDRSVMNFLYGDYTFVNPALAKHYGIPDVEGTAKDWVRIDHAAKFGRGGLLPMSVFLTANSPGLRTSPVKRGYWVVRRVLGERIPPPPAQVPDLPNDEAHSGSLTMRESLAKHREDKSCASCHARFDSYGLVFEGYGAVGERREKDFGGRPIDAHAPFPGGADREGLGGLVSFIREKREHEFVDNLTRKFSAYALGRSLLLSDDALMRETNAKLAANDYRFSTLVEAIITSPQFLTKRAGTPIAASLTSNSNN